MTLPIDVTELISGRTIEDSKTEYKEGWNPEKVIHSVCAFANDFEETGGGYVVIGIREEDSRPKEVVGLTESQVSEAVKELGDLCNLIKPRYEPTYSEEFYEGRRILVIWAQSGSFRPYTCPVSIGSDRRSNERCVFIRLGDRTVKANQEERRQLEFLARRTTFDDMENTDAEVSDIRTTMIEDYLTRVKSDMVSDGGLIEDRGTVLKKMRLIRGHPDAFRPLNIALMMFNRRPDDFIPFAWIDVVIMPDPTGEGMTERSFKGSIDTQLSNALDFIQSNVIAEKVFKVRDRPEAIRVYNYPFDAVREILVNAVYHKDYSIGEQVTVTVATDHIEVKSFPGPDRGITDEELEGLSLHPVHYRNKRLGYYLKELRLTELRGSGMQKIVRSMSQNGSDMPKYLTDEDRSMLRVEIPIHSRFRESAEEAVPPEKGRRSISEIRAQIMRVLNKEGCISTHDLAIALGYKGVTGSFYKALKQLMAEGRIVYLYPDTPRASNQRLCSVEEGQIDLEKDIRAMGVRRGCQILNMIHRMRGQRPGRMPLDSDAVSVDDQVAMLRACMRSRWVRPLVSSEQQREHRQDDDSSDRRPADELGRGVLPQHVPAPGRDREKQEHDEAPGPERPAEGQGGSDQSAHVQAGLPLQGDQHHRDGHDEVALHQHERYPRGIDGPHADASYRICEDPGDQGPEAVLAADDVAIGVAGLPGVVRDDRSGYDEDEQQADDRDDDVRGPIREQLGIEQQERGDSDDVRLEPLRYGLGDPAGPALDLAVVQMGGVVEMHPGFSF